MIEGQIVYLLTDLVHRGVRLSNGVLLTAEGDNLDSAQVRDELPADPDGERLAGLIGRGFELCQRCFPDQ